MVIEDMQQSLELLENIKNFFYNIEEIEKKCPLKDGAHGDGESPDLENSLKKKSEEEREKPL